MTWKPYGDLGDHVQGVSCPRCHDNTVVYSGNYFCAECSWAMNAHDNGEPETPKEREIIKAYLGQRWREYDAQGNIKERDRMGQHLLRFADKVNGKEVPDV